MKRCVSSINIGWKVVLAVFLTLFLIAVISSCRKKNINAFNTIVNGRVIDSITQKGIPGAKVTIIESTFIGRPCPCYNFQQVAITKTDKNGSFKLSFNGNDKGPYSASADDDTVACPINFHSDIQIGQINYITFLMIINKIANIIFIDSSKEFNAVTGISGTDFYTATTLGPPVINDPHVGSEYINLLHSPDTIQMKIVPYRENIIYLAVFNTYYEDTAQHFHTVPHYDLSFFHDSNNDTTIYLNY